MQFTLLDVLIEEPGFFERNSTLLPVIVAVAALAALVAFFIWKRKKRSS
jgi:LPXTG-motif cell wall-anchored protein